jgi:glycosidase
VKVLVRDHSLHHNKIKTAIDQESKHESYEPGEAADSAQSTRATDANYAVWTDQTTPWGRAC